jgi:hypothetical protein
MDRLLVERQSWDFGLLNLQGATTERVMETRTPKQSPDRALEQFTSTQGRVDRAFTRETKRR